MKKYNRIFTIVIDSLGIGEMSDSKEYGDVNVDTLRHISESVNEFKIPNLQKLGLANLHPIKHVEAVEKPFSSFYEDEGSKCWKRYNDWSLGNDGVKNRNTIPNIY